MGNFAENLNLGNRFRPPLVSLLNLCFKMKNKRWLSGPRSTL